MNRRIVVQLGYSCNNACVFCPHGSKREETPFLDNATIIRSLEKIAGDYGTDASQALVLTGGEPSINRELFAIVEAAKALGFEHIAIETNGRMLSYGPYAGKIARLGVSEFIVSLQGHLADAHDYLTQSGESFRQTVEGLNNLRKLGQRAVLRTLVNRSNYRHLLAMHLLGAKLGVAEHQFVFPLPEGRVLDEFVRIVPRFALLDAYTQKLLAQEKELAVPFFIEGFPRCFALGMKDHMLENRWEEVVSVVGDEITVATATTRREERKGFGDICNGCRLREECEGVWSEYSETYGWSEFEGVPDVVGSAK